MHPLVLVALLAAPAPTPERYRAAMDHDRDGRVEVSEYQAHLSRGFEAMDRNRNGVVDLDEFGGRARAPLPLSRHRRNLAEVFRRQDADGDGDLSVQELAAPPR